MRLNWTFISLPQLPGEDHRRVGPLRHRHPGENAERGSVRPERRGRRRGGGYRTVTARKPRLSLLFLCCLRLYIPCSVSSSSCRFVHQVAFLLTVGVKNSESDPAIRTCATKTDDIFPLCRKLELNSHTGFSLGKNALIFRFKSNVIQMDIITIPSFTTRLGFNVKVLQVSLHHGRELLSLCLCSTSVH